MHILKTTYLIAALVLVAGSVAQAERVFRVTGVVRAPFTDGRITVSHEDIVGYMPAMTMAFDVAGSALLEAAPLKPGDRVQFSLHVTETEVLADQFRVIGAGPAAPSVESALMPSPPRLQIGDEVPEFALESEEGQSLNRGSLRQGLTLITFMFTRCPVPNYCPLMAQRFGQLQHAIIADPKLDGHVRLLSITLDPAFDRPAVLKSYGEAVGAKPGVWHFGTGSQAQIGALVKAFSVYRERNGVTLDHTLCTALIDPSGRIVELWRGNGWTVEEVRTAMIARCTEMLKR